MWQLLWNILKVILSIELRIVCFFFCLEYAWNSWFLKLVLNWHSLATGNLSMFLGQNPLIEYLHHLENSSNLLIMSVSQLCLSLDSTRSNPRFAAANLSAKTGAKTLSVLAVQEIEWAEQADFGQIEEIGSTGQR